MSSIHRQLVDSHSRIKSGSDVDTDRQYGPLSRNHGQIAGPHANIDRCSDEATVRQYGPLWWGLDPSFFAAAHLSIRDIHWLQTYTDYPNICRYRNHPIRLVRALGYVVSVHLFSNRQLFQVDDGTGVISCVQWISEAAQEANASTWHVQLGTLVYVSGRISTFREVRQITVSSISVEDDVMNEALWWMRIQQLKQQVYDVPFEPLKANGNTREVVRKRPNDEPHEVSEAKFQKIVQKFLGQSGLETFKYQTLLNTDLGDLAIRVVSSKGYLHNHHA
ncbi:hypothetical protein, variant [Sphaeroforma arctica JP610]|uniref:CST complex subunit STN1 n=1 Tax=Sphaeroforma arctica JP610 TaxID=667725 RepID=A0A0L0FY29_9EUKA|nr:hypothetical protein, variant [Sphaeroforma arctica JP610]KNC81471.1 hypothetical protein, variant [Sphaeroforma arctica JP610]|eukprot:XP_014155373.1 hypothetical protein, variant [Sphaeroforma arctica JP610]